MTPTSEAMNEIDIRRARAFAEHRLSESRAALADISTTMEHCKSWFEAQGIAFTGADLVAMASLVMKRERDLADAAKRSKMGTCATASRNRRDHPPTAPLMHAPWSPTAALRST